MVTIARVFDDTTVVPAISFFTIRDDLVRKLVEYWPEPYEAPAWRSHWTEPIYRTVSLTHRSRSEEHAVGDGAVSSIGAVPVAPRRSREKHMTHFQMTPEQATRARAQVEPALGFLHEQLFFFFN